MNKIMNCRRSIIALVGIIALTSLGIYTGLDIGGIAIAIAGIVASIAGSNAWEKRSANGK